MLFTNGLFQNTLKTNTENCVNEGRRKVSSSDQYHLVHYILLFSVVTRHCWSNYNMVLWVSEMTSYIDSNVSKILFFVQLVWQSTQNLVASLMPTTKRRHTYVLW